MVVEAEKTVLVFRKRSYLAFWVCLDFSYGVCWWSRHKLVIVTLYSVFLSLLRQESGPVRK